MKLSPRFACPVVINPSGDVCLFDLIGNKQTKIILKSSSQDNVCPRIQLASSSNGIVSSNIVGFLEVVVGYTLKRGRMASIVRLP